jgi:RHS repeat-associated protein
VNGVEYKDRLLQRVPHSEGAIVLNEFGQYQHEYVLRDHLGNVRVTFRDGVNRGLELEDPNGGPNNVGIDPAYDDGVVTQDDIVQINNYYPFGLNMEGDWNGASGKNKYQYNGKEWNDDFGLGWYDYGARFYDPSIARWNAIDPIAVFFPNESPYNYVGGNPVRNVDMEGMFRIDAYFIGKYPNIATAIMKYLPSLKDNPQIIKAFTEVTGFSGEQFNKMIEYGAGPWVTATRSPVNYYDQGEFFVNQNQFSPTYPDHLFLSGSGLDALERELSTCSVSNYQAGMFLASIMVMHEAAHYAYYHTYGNKNPKRRDIERNGTDKGFSHRFTDPSSMIHDAFDKDAVRKYAQQNENSSHLNGLAHWVTTVNGLIGQGLIQFSVNGQPSNASKPKPKPKPKKPKPEPGA